MNAKVKRGHALVTSSYYSDDLVSRLTDLPARVGGTKKSSRSRNKNIIRRVSLPLKVSYEDLPGFATRYQHQICRKKGILLSQHAVNSYEKSMTDLIRVGQELGMPVSELRRMIIENALSYTDWEAQPEQEQRHTQMAGRSRFQRIG
ncbi:hypothetical protein WB66_23035 [bacteria symbiont BFo1 of Frankliniella occidentalis]|jgi:hypothetical protein|nr:hypothetical protein AI28_10800 [bacteria symbiont BFo1 of Frankliniella occidentalis]KYP82474.1 hypothetical protein WB66_23035 [bacteria symbiont BFo1 of Frankliniella occidentalis]KYP87176.1 hypothetical protein WB91_21990 [bacteria symbiont BFo1 of Frankliniella occidentalis]PIJ51270.1 hypothetical protein BOM23_22815 [Erwinia sp. OLMDLW33]